MVDDTNSASDLRHTEPAKYISPPMTNSVISQSKPAVYKGILNYKLKNKVGEGAVGEVYLVVHKKTQEIFALKRVNKIQADAVSRSTSFTLKILERKCKRDLEREKTYGSLGQESVHHRAQVFVDG